MNKDVTGTQSYIFNLYKMVKNVIENKYKGKRSMDSEIELFYKELRRIQDLAIGTVLCKESKYEKTQDMLEDITYEVIYMMCELIDGYRNNLVKYNLVNVQDNNIVNKKFELHNWCEEYLRCTNI